GGRRGRQRGSGSAEDPRLLLGQLKRRRLDPSAVVLVVTVLGVETRHALGQRLAALALEDQHRLGAALLRDGEFLEIGGRLALESPVDPIRETVAADRAPP